MIKQTCACGKCKIETRQEDLKMFEEIMNKSKCYCEVCAFEGKHELEGDKLVNMFEVLWDIKQKMEKKE